MTNSLLLDALEFYGKVAHQFGLPDDADTACNLVAAIEDILQRYGDNVHMVVGVDTACNAQAQQIQASETILASHGVAVSQNVADLAATDTCLEVELHGQSLRGELLLGHLGEDLRSINKDCVTTCRALIRDAELIKTSCEVLHLADAGLEVVELGIKMLSSLSPKAFCSLKKGCQRGKAQKAQLSRMYSE